MAVSANCARDQSISEVSMFFKHTVLILKYLWICAFNQFFPYILLLLLRGLLL